VAGPQRRELRLPHPGPRPPVHEERVNPLRRRLDVAFRNRCRQLQTHHVGAERLHGWGKPTSPAPKKPVVERYPQDLGRSHARFGP